MSTTTTSRVAGSTTGSGCARSTPCARCCSEHPSEHCGNPSGMTLDAVIFDWGGTLTPWHTIDPFECWLAVTADEVQAQALHAAEASVWAGVKDEHRSGTFEQILEQAALTL